MTIEGFESAELSHLGRVREDNEDACLRLPDFGVYCVADGMGGAAGGDLASEAIITKLRAAFSGSEPEIPDTFAARVSLVIKALNQASQWIKHFADEKAIGQMGSTVVSFVLDPADPTRALALHAGDSRLYRFRDGGLQLLTCDHTAAATLAARSGCDPASLPARYRNELLKAVGLKESVELEETPVGVASGDTFLLCSDGLTRMLPDAAISRILKREAGAGLDSAAEALVADANKAGGRDNVTVVLVRAGDLSQRRKILDLTGKTREK